ncbi:hypothetical protein BpHYR1_013318 [Brachionus plicatilis]|uniref:Uncharacterized protein n=1 Tax=Brachionus plicatilis TaxID=10195 RepID=A0A3M7QSS3_BRAPC|nr:hypothetical protein BpHYR1_013318 [Brachionus plicatilis]
MKQKTVLKILANNLHLCSSSLNLASSTSFKSMLDHNLSATALALGHNLEMLLAPSTNSDHIQASPLIQKNFLLEEETQLNDIDDYGKIFYLYVLIKLKSQLLKIKI